MIRKYEKYKDSGVEWIGEIPEGWEVKKIKYLALGKDTLFLDGDWIESKDIVFDDSQIRYITTGNIGEGKYKEQGLTYITDETFKKLNCTEIFPGDLLISRLNPPIGRCCIVPDLGSRIVTSVDNVVLRPSGQYQKEFLKYVMSSPRYFEYTSLIARGATMQRISRGLLGDIELPITYDGSEQTAIATFLDRKTAEIDQLIARKEKLIALYEEEKTAIINHAVTRGLDPDAITKPSGVDWLGDIPEHWEIKRLKRLCTIISKGTTPSTIGREILPSGDIRFIKAENVVNNAVVAEPNNFIDKKTNELISRSQLEKSDILFVIAGATIGKVAILTENFCPANTNQAVSFIRLAEKDNVLFIWYWLQSDSINKVLWLDAVQSAQPNLSMENLGNFYVPFPTVAEQTAIVAHIETECSRLNTIIEKFKKQIELFKEYRTTLISEVVTGKIDVRDEVAA